MSFDETDPVPNAGLLSAAGGRSIWTWPSWSTPGLRLARHGANSGAKALGLAKDGDQRRGRPCGAA